MSWCHTREVISNGNLSLTLFTWNFLETRTCGKQQRRRLWDHIRRILWDLMEAHMPSCSHMLIVQIFLSTVCREFNSSPTKGCAVLATLWSTTPGVLKLTTWRMRSIGGIVLDHPGGLTAHYPNDTQYWRLYAQPPKRCASRLYDRPPIGCTASTFVGFEWIPFIDRNIMIYDLLQENLQPHEIDGHLCWK